MKLFRTLAGLCVFALAALPAVAQHGGSSVGGSHGGGSHGSTAGGHSPSGASTGHFSGGSSRSTGSVSAAGRSVGYSGARGSSQSSNYPGTGMRDAGARGGAFASGFTNHGGIRFSDFGVAESPRFTASMLPSRPAAVTSRQAPQIAAFSERPEHERRDRTGHGSFDRGDHGFRRFPHFGFLVFGEFATPFCDPFGWVAYDQSFLANNPSGCFGDEQLGENSATDADSDQPSEYGSTSADDDAAASPDDAAMADVTAEAAPQVTTLLQLKDGSMYGLTAYWVDGGELHYVTNYGGANAVPLDRIDLAKTVQLNASHGQAFVLAEKTAPNKSPR